MKYIYQYIIERLSPFNVWIMVGLPGAGKSTYIKNNLPKSITIISQDNIRQELGIMNDETHKKIGNKEQEKKVKEICLDRIDKAIKNRIDFVIDNTNVKAGLVKNFYDRLIRTNANVKIVIVDTDIETCIKRRKDDIPRKVIEDMKLGIDKVKQIFGKNKNTIIIKGES